MGYEDGIDPNNDFGLQTFSHLVINHTHQVSISDCYYNSDSVDKAVGSLMPFFILYTDTVHSPIYRSNIGRYLINIVQCVTA